MRQRIFLGFASILVLFIGVGLYAVWLFSRISDMDQVNPQARVLSANARQTMLIVFLVGVGIVLSVYFATRRAIFKPIQTLTSVAKELGAGNLDQVVPVQSNDELGRWQPRSTNSLPNCALTVESRRIRFCKRAR
jgi:methyl-accepting chemotaxis protein